VEISRKSFALHLCIPTYLLVKFKILETKTVFSVVI